MYSTMHYKEPLESFDKNGAYFGLSPVAIGGGPGAEVKAACLEGGDPRVVVSTAALHARVRGSVPVSAV